MKTIKWTLISLFMSVILILGCSDPKGETEAQKLIDKQTELAREGQKDVEDFLSQMSTIKDSMEITQKKLVEDRQSITKEIKSLEKEKALLEINKEQEVFNQLQRKKDSLNEEFDANMAIDRRVFDQIEHIEKIEDSLVSTSAVLTGIIEESEARYGGDISNIDRLISKIENDQMTAQRSINLNTKKIDVAGRKVHLLQDEILVLQEEKTHQLRTGASAEVIAGIENEIKNLENQISASREKVENAQKSIASNKIRVTELDLQKESLQGEIKEYYNTKGVVSDFVESEKKRIEQKVSELQTETEMLTVDKTNIAQSRQQIEHKLADIEQQITTLENTRLPELQHRVSDLDFTFNEGDRGLSKPRFVSEIDSLNTAIEESNNKFNRDTEELSNEQLLLSRQVESEKQRSASTKKAMIILSVTIVAFLIILYFIGRVKRRQLLKLK